MTKIYRINTGQVEGVDANNNETGRVPPRGEIGLYGDNNNKLTLVIGDGVRTHLNSKVLNKGTFYGGNADSSDGLSRDTIKLVPDEFLRQAGSDQYLVIDPTAGDPVGHIHIRAGGTINQSTADIFLGGENNNVRVSDTDDRVTITTDAGEGTRTWTFGSNGDLTFPGSSNARIGESEPGLVVFSDNGFAVLTNSNPISNYQVEFTGFVSNGFGDSPGATLTITGIINGTITDGMTIYGAGLPEEGWTLTFGGGVMAPQGSGGTGNYLLDGANILTSSQSFNNGVAAVGSQSWIFGTDGITQFPDGTTSTGATVFANSSSYKIQTISFGGSPSNVVSTYEFGVARMTIPGNGFIFNEGQEGYWALDGVNSRLQFPNLARIGYGTNEGLSNEEDLRIYADNTGSIFLLAGSEEWSFGNNGDLELPTNGDIVDSNGVSQLANRAEGNWTVTTGTNTYSFTVPSDGTYIMWVKGNIPNGIITWNATVSVSNTNVPTIGTQYAWNYTGGGSPILLTAIPDQIKGTQGTISTDNTYVGTTSNRFDFGITNNSGALQTVYYGYTKI